MLSKQSIHLQKDLYLYLKALDMEQDKEILEILGMVDLYQKYIQVISNVYWEQIACVQIENAKMWYKTRMHSLTGFILPIKRERETKKKMKKT